MEKKRTVSASMRKKYALSPYIWKSCFGCGWDWRHHWAEKDLAPVKIDGKTFHVCPDCFEEVKEQYKVEL